MDAGLAAAHLGTITTGFSVGAAIGGPVAAPLGAVIGGIIGTMATESPLPNSALKTPLEIFSSRQPPQPQQSAAVTIVQQQAGISAAEAQYYLDEAGGDTEQACPAIVHAPPLHFRRAVSAA